MDPVADRIAMHLLCALGWHRPESITIRNEGRHFGRCRRCKADLIEVGLGWNLAPRGYRVVWKKPVGDIPPAADAVRDPMPEIVVDAPSPSPEIEAQAAAEAEVEVEVEVEAEAEASAPAPLVRRVRADRRTAKAAELPPHLAGKERRGKGGRRKALGKKPGLPPA
jgi:hypothetical protein